MGETVSLCLTAAGDRLCYVAGQPREDSIMFKRFTQTTFGLVLALGLGSATMAENIAPPQGDPILTVSGTIQTANVDDTLVFDRALLMELPATTFETSTIWTDGVHEFTGVELVDLVAAMDVQDGVLLATAINDYTVEIPVSDAVQDGPIIAYLMDGAEMSVRDKGPLWVIYPYDSNADYRTEVVYSRSIWQLDRIEVVQ